MQLMKSMKKAKGEEIEEMMKEPKTALKALLEVPEENKRNKAVPQAGIKPPAIQKVARPPPVVHAKVPGEQQANTDIEKPVEDLHNIADGDIGKDKEAKGEVKVEETENLKAKEDEVKKDEAREDELEISDTPAPNMETPLQSQTIEETKEAEDPSANEITSATEPIPVPKIEEPMPQEPPKELITSGDTPTAKKSQEFSKAEDAANLLAPPLEAALAAHSTKCKSAQAPQEELKFTKESLQGEDRNSLHGMYKEIRRELDAKKRKLHTTNNQLNFCRVGSEL
eukprot:TRINITY_DN7905_c0_g1_i10.p2 TRINITY_DN7905_c0_g1~~TRINITY_DN7905_c0_g1_i10.p2  ORF type:complete len:283 (+),score=79.81 TRINITY_DN7905_c0_g1_i10:270-1118(+)